MYFSACIMQYQNISSKISQAVSLSTKVKQIRMYETNYIIWLDKHQIKLLAFGDLIADS